MTGSRLELGLGYLSKFVEMRGRMESIAGGRGESNVWYGSPLLVLIAAGQLGVVLHLPLRLEEYVAIFGAMVCFVVVKHAIRRSDSVWALNRDHDRDSMNRLSGYIEGIFDRSFSYFFLAGVSQNFSPSFLVAHDYQNCCYALT
jgi:hypothetical protein